jgi:hypothetical protein
MSLGSLRREHAARPALVARISGCARSLWVELSHLATVSWMTAFSASRPLSRVSAMVSLLKRHRVEPARRERVFIPHSGRCPRRARRAQEVGERTYMDRTARRRVGVPPEAAVAGPVAHISVALCILCSTTRAFQSHALAEGGRFRWGCEWLTGRRFARRTFSASSSNRKVRKT